MKASDGLHVLQTALYEVNTVRGLIKVEAGTFKCETFESKGQQHPGGLVNFSL